MADQLQSTSGDVVVADGNPKPSSLAEFQLKVFGFTTRGFINNVHNMMIRSWAAVIEQTVIPKVIATLNLSDKQRSDNKILPELQKLLLNRLFQNGKLEEILTQAEEYFDTYVFRFPNNKIRPEGNKLSIGEEEKAHDEDQLWAVIEDLERKIVLLRYEMKLYDEENLKIDQCQRLVEELVKLEVQKGVGKVEVE